MIGPLRNAELRTGRAFGRALAQLGSFCWKHARLVVLLWLLATRHRGRPYRQVDRTTPERDRRHTRKHLPESSTICSVPISGEETPRP